ncbi:MAG: hypothetical protein Q8R67_05950 [Rhodoferax sp.]|nr:hypothetical protein [Rhodoferax sp.]MDP3651212.1 hypothetical protein [Rhodoferax sp.]
MNSLKVCLIGIVLVFIHDSVFAQIGETKTVAIPVGNNLPPLRVLVVNSERFPPLGKGAVEKIIATTTSLIQSHFGVSISFITPRFTSLEKLATNLLPAHLAWARSQTLDLSKADDQATLIQTMRKDLLENGGTVQDLQRYSAPYLFKPPANDTLDAFADALAYTQVGLMSEWRTQMHSDKKPLLVSDGFAEYSFWLVLGYTSLPYEIVITNQLMASAEKIANSVHSALRGGVTNGLTGSSRGSASGTFSILSVFPLVSDDPITTKLRNGKIYSKADSLTYAAAILAHELGHQLFHLGHPFNNPACLMRPPLRLQFDDWYAQLDPQKCAMGSDDAMTPGRTVRYSEIRK